MCVLYHSCLQKQLLIPEDSARAVNHQLKLNLWQLVNFSLSVEEGRHIVWKSEIITRNRKDFIMVIISLILIGTQFIQYKQILYLRYHLTSTSRSYFMFFFMLNLLYIDIDTLHIWVISYLCTKFIIHRKVVNKSVFSSFQWPWLSVSHMIRCMEQLEDWPLSGFLHYFQTEQSHLNFRFLSASTVSVNCGSMKV